MTNGDTNPNKFPKVPKGLRLLIAIPLICSLTCGSIYWLSEIRPQFVVLDISPPTGVARGWYNTQEIIWSDATNKVFIFRQEISYFTNEDWETVVTYFEDQLADGGWERGGFGGNNACAIYLSEAKFLPLGTNGYVSYRQPLSRGDIGRSLSFAVPTVCLAVYPRVGMPVGRGFEIVLISGNPTFLTSSADYWSF